MKQHIIREQGQDPNTQNQKSARGRKPAGTGKLDGKGRGKTSKALPPAVKAKLQSSGRGDGSRTSNPKGIPLPAPLEEPMLVI